MSKPIPKAEGADNTRSLIQEGFPFFIKRHKELGTNIFETRLIGRKAICIVGEEASKIFYDTEKFKREGAMPKPLKMSLFGEGSLHGMDGEKHLHRKRTFLSMFTPDRVEDLKQNALEELDRKVEQWQERDKVVLYEEFPEILTRAVCKWAGVPLEEHEVRQRTDEMMSMVESFGGSLSRFQEGKKSRDSHEAWLKQIIKDVRKGKLQPEPNTAAYIMAHHRETDGKLWDVQTAAVELSNSFRPLLATVHLLVLGAVAMHEHPETRTRLEKGEPLYSHWFAQETRRFYPFVPAMIAKVKTPFLWEGYEFKKNTRVVLDLYGTNHHADSWVHPDAFIPERFENWQGSPFSFVPQGGGDHHTGHRCAGEWLTVIVMSSFFEFLAKNVSYDVSEQNLSFSLERMPTRPESGFVIENVRKKDAYEETFDELNQGFAARR
ncbi:cytochrome P450 [Halobacillus salinus]|uniref:Cytochrome P450 n=1 Tax=Halobacillus salinus TaxID=192814 RepID=A0A4Z0H3L1_9BACI|nr:cytochrome P450 [Halobacillus salinus]TGB03785.1 cytochrome P450 [Halobacillus salinus]